MVSQTQTFVGADISIHALHEESDTVAVCESAVRQVISIHALHEESDARPDSSRRAYRNFNPRSP